MHRIARIVFSVASSVLLVSGISVPAHAESSFMGSSVWGEPDSQALNLGRTKEVEALARFGDWAIWKTLFGHKLLTYEQAEALVGRKYSTSDEKYRANCLRDRKYFKGDRSSIEHRYFLENTPMENAPMDVGDQEGEYRHLAFFADLDRLQSGFKDLEEQREWLYSEDDPGCYLGRVQTSTERRDVLSSVAFSSGRQIWEK